MLTLILSTEDRFLALDSDELKLVYGFRVIGTDSWTVAAYEPSSIAGPHSSIHSFDWIDQVLRISSYWGRIGTRRLPADLEALPARSQERLDAVRAHKASEYEEAHAIIERCYELAYGGLGWMRATWDMGQVSFRGNPPVVAAPVSEPAIPPRCGCPASDPKAAKAHRIAGYLVCSRCGGRLG